VTPSCRGFSLPSSRRSRWVSTCAGNPDPRYVPPSGFRNPSAVYSTHCFAGLFHPAATSRVPPFRGFSRSAAAPVRRRRRPPCPLPSARSPVARLPRALVWTSRLCSTERCVRSKPGVSQLRGRSPLRISSSGCLVRAPYLVAQAPLMALAKPSSPLLALRCSRLRSPPACCRLARGCLRLLGHRPARGFCLPMCRPCGQLNG
jgi:hypothetical protein